MDISDIKLGLIINMDGQPMQVIWSNFMRTAQRKPVMQTKLKNIINGKVIEYSFKYGEKFDEADVTRERASFLYTDDAGTHYMNQETFETIDFSKEITRDLEKYLKEGMEVTVVRYNGNPVSVEIPIKVDLRVTEAPPSITGNSAGSITKPVTTETGLVVNTPMFIKEGDMIRVDTRSGEYVERANS